MISWCESVGAEDLWRGAFLLGVGATEFVFVPRQKLLLEVYCTRVCDHDEEGRSHVRPVSSHDNNDESRSHVRPASNHDNQASFATMASSAGGGTVRQSQGHGNSFTYSQTQNPALN